MEKNYLVTFYTRKDRVLRSWEYYTKARSLKSAKEFAQNAWYASNASHMFDCCSRIVGAIPGDREEGSFFMTSWEPVTWGSRRRY